VEGLIRKSGWKYSIVPGRSWTPDLERQERMTALRYRELEVMQAFCRHDGCLMEYIARELDDPHARPCGKCANCAGDVVPREVDAALAINANRFLKRLDRVIEPRRNWPSKTATHWNAYKIRAELAIEPGRALCFYLDAGWGRAVHDGKYRSGRFPDELVEAARELIVDRWRPSPFLEWVTAVPSRRRPELVPDFARRLAQELGLPFREAIRKTRDTEEQKLMQNSAQQVRNLLGAFAIEPAQLRGGAALLVDDIVDSRWTLTYTGALLREAGAARVFPFALAMASTA
jgi:ATP-dependent DNA helicase RecQ